MNAAALAKRAEEEKLHKEKMKEIEDKLKAKEAELKRLDDVKKERERKIQDDRARENEARNRIQQEALAR